MGPNGSGKSTLLRLVSTELPSRPGTLTLFGETCERPSRALRRRIGIVQDTPVHVDELTGMENGLLFAELYGLGRAEAAGLAQDATARASALREALRAATELDAGGLVERAERALAEA